MAEAVKARPSPKRLGPFPSAGSVARVALGLALIGVLYWWGLIDAKAIGALALRPGLLALATATAFATIPLEALRWHVLLRSQGLAKDLWTTTRILAISQFFANFLPGAAGGDLIRGLYIYKSSEGRRAPALLSIFVDRLIGFVAFLVLGSAALLARPGARLGWLELAVVAASALYMAGLVLVFLFAPALAAAARRLLPRRSANLARIIDDTGTAFRLYARDWRSSTLALLLSAAVVGACVGPIVTIAAAMPMGGAGPADDFIAGLYAFLVNSVPVTPGGLGIGEAAFASAAAVLSPGGGVAAYGTIFLAYRCIFVLATLPGLAVYMMGSAGAREA